MFLHSVIVRGVIPKCHILFFHKHKKNSDCQVPESPKDSCLQPPGLWNREDVIVSCFNCKDLLNPRGSLDLRAVDDALLIEVS